jgi:O-antigen/teichoic acid export membrane protein
MKLHIKTLASQTAVYGISSIAARLLNYLLTPYLTRLLTRAEYGVVTDMYALIPFALVVLTMGMESGYFKFAGQERADKRRVFRSVWGATTVAALLFFAVVMVFRGGIAEVMDYAQTPHYVTLVAAIIALDVITALPFARLRQEGRAAMFVVVRVASVVVNVALTVVFYSVMHGTGPVWVFVANLAASALTLLMLLMFMRSEARVLANPAKQGPTARSQPGTEGCNSRGSLSPLRSATGVDWHTLKPILLYSLPLLIGGIAGTANEFIDRQMIKYLMPAGEAMSALGVYGAVVKIGVVLLLFTQMYRLAAEPFFLAGFKKDDFVRTNAEAMKWFIIASVAIFLGITLFTDLFALLVGRDFREGIFILPVVLVSNILTGVVLNLSFWYKQYGRTRFAIIVTGTGLLFTVAFNILLVPRLGYFGAALARLICEAAMVALSYHLNRRHCPTPYPLRRIAEYTLLGAILYAANFATALLHTTPKYLCNFALLTIFALYTIRRERVFHLF